MADSAGAPAEPAADAAPASAALADADRKYADGLRALGRGNYDDALVLLGAALEARVAAHGEAAPACGTAYLRYGEALFLKAQQDVDVFGAPAQKMMSDKDAAAETGGPAEAGPAVMPAAGSAPPAAKAEGKGQGPAADAAADEEDDGEDVDDEDDDGDEPGDDGGDDGAEDLGLAWQMLELARLAFERAGPAAAVELAEAHALLGDVKLESEDFAGAEAELSHSLQLLEQAGVGPDDRLLADVQFKLCCCLQWTGDLPRALSYCMQALGTIDKRSVRVKSGVTPPSGPPPPAGDAAAAAAAISRELSDLAAVSRELADKADELRESLANVEANKQEIKGMLASMLTGGGLPTARAGAAGAGPSSSAGAAAASGGGFLAGFSAAAVENACSAFGAPSLARPPAAGAGAAAGGSGAGVVNLGVVGKGRSRITLAPVEPAAVGGSAANAGPAATAAPPAAHPACEPPAKKARPDGEAPQPAT